MICTNCHSEQSLHNSQGRCPGATTLFLEPSCPYEVRKSTLKHIGLNCGKKTDGESIYCPKHRVMVGGRPEEERKKMQKLRNRKAYLSDQRKELESSPLAGYNPAFDQKRRGAYSQ